MAILEFLITCQTNDRTHDGLYSIDRTIWRAEFLTAKMIDHLIEKTVRQMNCKGKIVEIDERLYAKVKHSKGTSQSYPHMEAITIKESGFLASGTDSDHEKNCESVFEEVGVAICKLCLNTTKKKFSDAIFEKFSKINNLMHK
ncbi:hypothetical protein BpHYR1_014781 [Brachionus plicatilis]|uniref:Uncharacterized protein n=1 Tax=Brachionus plicatilis TaxID=10195 RepID=A0A3M7RVN5_BRAPC|nr:hypothetical protein BpHYR1_014781 [Brachionus plicatilis]